VLTGGTSGYHKDGWVQLKNVDALATGYTDPNSDPNSPVYGDWRTLPAAARSEFCMGCHDPDGATIVADRVSDPNEPDKTTDALNPFNDGVTNAHEPDGFDGAPAPHSRGQVVDVYSQFDPNNISHHAVRGAAYGSAAPFGSNVDNAIQGVLTDPNNLHWASILDCEDCHGSSDPNVPLAGHGTANARYMLRDKNGQDVAAADPDHICYRCHNPSDTVSVYPEHDKSAHMDDTQNLFDISCLNCHGGGTWGGIHGVNDPVTDDDANPGSPYNPNVFTYGSALDLISNWTSWANRGVSCSSQNSTTAPTTLNQCDHHGGSSEWGRVSGNTRTYRAP
jgi:hypothetical protein